MHKYSFNIWYFVDNDTGTLYIEIKKNIFDNHKWSPHEVNRINIDYKHYYDVEFIDETVNDTYLFNVLAYYGSWFERNMK